MSDRVSPIRANHEVCAHFHFAARSFCAYAAHALILDEQIGDLGLHVQFKGREPFGMTGEKIEKIPLRHERNEFAVRRELREIRDGHGPTVDHTA